MQYYLRFHLAVIVVINHMWYDVFGTSGSYGVVGFFVISGYVITKVLNERYYQLEQGLKKFWINRFLRLYPTYWFASILGLAIAALSPESASSLGVGISLPQNEYGQSRLAKLNLDTEGWASYYLVNFSMLGLQSPFLWKSPIILAPTAWSTNVELYYYAVLSFFAAKGLSSSKLFLYFGVLFLAVLFGIVLGNAFGYVDYYRISPSMYFRSISLFYDSFLGWTFFFAVGCFIYFLPKLNVSLTCRILLLIVCLLFPFILTKSNPNIFIFMRIVYGLLIALLLLSYSDKCDSAKLRFLGDLSYPMFLMHWPIAGFVTWLFGVHKNSLEMLLINLPITILTSVLVVLFLEQPIQKLRRKYRR